MQINITFRGLQQVIALQCCGIGLRGENNVTAACFSRKQM